MNPVVRSPIHLRSVTSADTASTDSNDRPENTAVATQQQEMQPASKASPSVKAASTQPPKDVRKKNASTSGAAALTQNDSTSLLEMKKQMQYLRQELMETQSQLNESKRRCQELESAPSAREVSDFNINFASMPASAAIATTTTTDYRYMQASSVSYSTAAITTQPYYAPNVSIPPNLPNAGVAPLPSQFDVNAGATATTNILTAPSNIYCSQMQQPSDMHSVQSEVRIPRKLQDLPDFSGQPEDWPLFHTAFCQSTAAYGYNNLENNQRLQKCLKDDAKEIVKALLIHPDNVNAVIDQLKFRFGRPEQLINSQLKQIREQPFISENNLGKLVPFSTKVKNLSLFLKSVGGEHHIANPTLLEELMSKLPMSKRLEWARIATNIKPYATIEHFSDWLCEVAQLVCLIQDVNNNTDAKRRVLHASQREQWCIACKSNHKIIECQKFLGMQVDDRWNLAKSCRLCFSCLNVGHTTRECRKKKHCSQDGCSRKHHPLLHADTLRAVPPSQPKSTNFSTENTQNVLSCSNNNKKLLFRVLPVTLYGEKRKLDIFALFDDGSSITILDKDVADEIGVRGKGSQLNIQWLGGRSARESSMTFNLKISGTGKKKMHQLRNVFAVSNLNLPEQTLNESDLQACFKNMRYCPMETYTGVVPKLLIGLDHASLGLPENVKVDSRSGPFSCNTELGWVVFGPCESIAPSPKSCLFVKLEEEEEIHGLVENYFNIENMGVRPAPPVESHDDLRAKQILDDTTKRIGKRFQTGLLWKNDDVQLPDSRPMALTRLKGIERKMTRDEEFATAYKEVISSYIEKGYARKIPKEETEVTSERKWYLPHFGVSNPNKKKIRLVFDAAARVDGTSLNDHLLKGPQCISSLLSILFNFRTRKIAVTADIREMFHQVVIQPSDRISQRFLWRSDDNSPPEDYEMMVMIFGAACSPCSAIYVMNTNAMEHASCHQRAIEAIRTRHYMDDFVDSFDSTEEAISISKQVREIHNDGGFHLGKFVSNSKNVVEALDGSTSKKEILVNEGTGKVLGLYWDADSDTFRFNLKFSKTNQDVTSGERRPTKRQVLSIIMSTFDPLGFLSNFTIGGKLVLRRIWKQVIKWDETIPDNINASWEQWRKQLTRVAKFRLPRFYFHPGDQKKIQLHIFVDASEEAFSAVAYWRFLEDDDSVSVSFVCSKTKCSPLVNVSIPRLELQAAVLGTRMKQTIVSEHNIAPEAIIMWSDSKTVLKWISSSHRKYKPYVAHRIAEILQSTDVNDWKWIPTLENVADDATRSRNNIDFSINSRWLSGPPFLKLPEHEWPGYEQLNLDPEDEGEMEEIIRTRVMFATATSQFIDLERFSSYNRLKRTVAYVLRFVNRCRARGSNLDLHGLTVKDLEGAERILCQQVQEAAFLNEIQRIKGGQPVPKNHCLANLSPYVAEDGLLRVYGRIDAATFLPYSARRPIILPKDHFFTRLIVRHYHSEMKHQNHESTIGEIRKKFWIPQLRSVLKSIVSTCFICRKNNAKPVTPIMGPLPIDRLQPHAFPFRFTGLDYFGPLSVTVGRRTEKRWVALFTCLSIRAIHLEIAHDLSTDSCIIAIKNFVNRRGVPMKIRSDNGKNFVGVNEQAKRFEEVFEAERVQSELATKGVEWQFNWPANPSEGGVWERMVRCVKRVLQQTLKNESPREHVLQCLLIEAENMVNSRPLTHLPISPDDEEPLTPNHFLINQPNAPLTPAINEPDDKIFTLRKQWRIARSLRDRLWKRWVNEYLPTLTRRVKWCEHKEPIKEGNVVFICDPNLPRKQWRRGLVTCLYAGADGVPRRADVKTSSGVLRRAVSKLAVLDIEDGEARRSTGAGMLQND